MNLQKVACDSDMMPKPNVMLDSPNKKKENQFF
jgi:hypothetical protein